MASKVNIDIIIRTTLEGSRRNQLHRAIASIQTQLGVNAVPIVVVNGGLYDKSLIQELRKRNDIRLEYIEKASAGLAMRVGRELVTADYFGFLDDDDEYLDGALQTRLAPMLQDASIDVVVTNGYLEKDGIREIQIPNITQHQDNPLDGIITRCWLASCGGLFRSSSIPKELFDGTTDYQELTLLAFKIAVNHKKVNFLDTQTYVVHDTPSSASKTFVHIEATLSLLEHIRNYNLPRSTRLQLEQKYHDTLHVLANLSLQQGQYKKAWLYHMKSLKPPFTFKYLAYTRKLFFIS